MEEILLLEVCLQPTVEAEAKEESLVLSLEVVEEVQLVLELTWD